MTYRKKLIEVSLPLESINEESVREKSIRQGHPSTIHLWWARRPLAACRAVLWSTLVDDPSEYLKDEGAANSERDRLFSILEKLIKWENSNNQEVLDSARLEIARSVAREIGCDLPIGREAIKNFLVTKVPPILDPFAGGGAIPLEALRLGLISFASDLNPVAVLINKALIEILPYVSGMPPIHPPKTTQHQGLLLNKEWQGAEGLAEDVHYYGEWLRNEVEKSIGYLYPKILITSELLEDDPDLKKYGLRISDELSVISWLWVRTITCPNPACGAEVPLAHSFILASKKEKRVWAEPIYDRTKTPMTLSFILKSGKGSPPERTVTRTGARCSACGMPIALDHVRSEGKAKRMGARLMAIVADSPQGRIYFKPLPNHEEIIKQAKPEWIPDSELVPNSRHMTPVIYGMTTHADLFTNRQLVALNTFSDLLLEVHRLVLDRAQEIGIPNGVKYANAIITYLAFILDKQADLCNSLNRWEPIAQCPRQLFGRQAIPMVWDFAESNPIGNSSGSWTVLLDNLSRSLKSPLLDFNPGLVGNVKQLDASSLKPFVSPPVISTDPPYYDNVPYADLSDFFYIWLRRTLGKIYPDLFQTMLVPKTQELVADPFRHGSKEASRQFFENGMGMVFKQINLTANKSFPVTVYYAFKQIETDDGEDETDFRSNLSLNASTGWETMLNGIIESGFQITGTWPIRTENSSRMRGQNSNALASSIVLVCRPRVESASTITRREFLGFLKRELPPSLRQLQVGNIAPVDLAQAAIGPGMAIFSRYTHVLEADGSAMRVRAALALINQALDEYLAEQEGEYDSDTRWALAWFEQYGHDQGLYGIAETLSKAKNTSVEGLSHAGFLEARAGKVRLLTRDELEENWDPSKDKRLTAWEATQYLIRTLDKEGEKGAGALMGKLGATGETARDLAYRLYTICERKGWAQDALAYNMLVVAWPRIKEQSGKGPRQESLL